MALIFRSKSYCSICKNVLKESDAILGFPHFVEQDHKLYSFSDSGMHESCFENWEFKNDFISLNKKVQALPIDLNEPYIKEMIENFGIPKWVQEKIDKGEVVK